MEFKSADISFSNTTNRFRNEMESFKELEDIYFHSEEEEASAKVDASVEKIERLSAEKHKDKAKGLKRSLKKHPKEKQRDNANKKIKKSQKKEAKKAAKKAARKTSVANMLKVKKSMGNELSGSRGDTGDAFKNGNTGLVSVVLEKINPMHYLKSYLIKLAAVLAPATIIFMTAAIIVVVMVALVFDVLSPIIQARQIIDNIISFFSGGDDDEEEEDEYEYVESGLSQSEIDSILAEIDYDSTQESVIEYALQAVGMPYSQANRMSEEAYDCSSLAYYSWSEGGVDLSFGGTDPPCAADMARQLEDNGKALNMGDPDNFEMLPGDLIFYGGSTNGRYRGIYHVAIYIGNGKVVEALNDECGVVYQNIRSENAIMICRPNL